MLQLGFIFNSLLATKWYNYLYRNIDKRWRRYIDDVAVIQAFGNEKKQWNTIFCQRSIPKLGSYAPLIEPTRKIADVLIDTVSDGITNSGYGPSCLIHKRHIEKLKKGFEMLEYVEFIVKREASRKLKSGGRGPRYMLNLSILMEVLGRLTQDLFNYI